MKETGLRTGKVSSIDYKTGMMQIVYADKGNAVTTLMPYVNFNNEYCMPKVGELVLVGHLTNGSSRGVVLGTMWNKKNMPAESGEGLYRKEFSKRKGTAIEQYSDENGEFLLKAPILLFHGVDSTDLEGPEVNIAANLKTSFESPEHSAVMREVQIAGLEESDISLAINNNIRITMDLSALEAFILSIKLETMEELGIKAGTGIKIQATEEFKLEDKKFQTTLSSILERLEALDGNKEARK